MLGLVLTQSAVAQQSATVPTGDLVWHTDYGTAVREAKQSSKMLLIFFTRGADDATAKKFDADVLGDPQLKPMLARYELARLPVDATIQESGKPIRLLSHASFAEMLGQQGIAVLDFEHEKTPYYGYVVSTFPFTRGKYYTMPALSVILDLPAGTLTQRTMVYAVRVHPESPESTKGDQHQTLASEASQHSQYQASITLQGHHSWDTRFQRINSRMPSGVLATEVVAESWPNEGLVEACVDCVASWRQSPGHWGAVRSRHPWFGYDIKRGRNGIWYATGIFGRR
jgi:hypothetical protein